MCPAKVGSFGAVSSFDGLAPDYATARRLFLDASDRVGCAVSHHLIPDRGPAGEELSIDVAWLGKAEAVKVILVVSGTHGVEGFAGSLCQSRWLESCGSVPLPDDLAVMFVHAHNPFGFAWVRRVNEDNVDLNRNYIDFSHPPTNDDYEELADALAPREWTEASRAVTDATILAWATEHGFDAVQAAVSAGQYRHADGLFYGGSHPARSQSLLREILTTRLDRVGQLAILDLHTGLGPRGEVELIISEQPSSDAYDRAVSWWGGQVASNVGGGSVSAPLHGEWMPVAERWLAGTEVTAIALEWGTVDSITVLQALRGDNWLHNHGDPTGPEAGAIKADLMEAFAPRDPVWVEQVYTCFDRVLDQTIRALSDTADPPDVADPPATHLA